MKSGVNCNYCYLYSSSLIRQLPLLCTVNYGLVLLIFLNLEYKWDSTILYTLVYNYYAF